MLTKTKLMVQQSQALMSTFIYCLKTSQIIILNDMIKNLDESSNSSKYIFNVYFRYALNNHRLLVAVESGYI